MRTRTLINYDAVRARLSVIGVALFLILEIASASADSAAHVRWDIINLVAPNDLAAGGIASADANGHLRITLTGSGTFVAPSGNSGASSAATGGGTWVVCDAASICNNGTYQVTGVIRWDADAADGSLDPSLDDVIGAASNLSAGLAVLRISYSDGDHGILVLGSVLTGTQNIAFEGITATKRYLNFWDTVPPSGGFFPTFSSNANRVLFHVRP